MRSPLLVLKHYVRTLLDSTPPLSLANMQRAVHATEASYGTNVIKMRAGQALCEMYVEILVNSQRHVNTTSLATGETCYDFNGKPLIAAPGMPPCEMLFITAQGSRMCQFKEL